jgi:hypothetical protein
LILAAFSARLNSHPIDEDLSMGTPVKSCPDTSCSFESVFPQPVKPRPFKATKAKAKTKAGPSTSLRSAQDDKQFCSNGVTAGFERSFAAWVDF